METSNQTQLQHPLSQCQDDKTATAADTEHTCSNATTTTTCTCPTTITTTITTAPTSSLSTVTTSTSSTATTHTTSTSTPSAATKNVKNLSIREFFTTRLMRARSFEGGQPGGGPNSPKDDNLNWFEEFRARVTKKSQQATSSKQQQTATNDDQTITDIKGQNNKSNRLNNSTKSRLADAAEDIIVNDTFCDMPQAIDSIDDNDIPFDEHHDTIGSPNCPSFKTTRLRNRLRNSMNNDSPDFDTASVKTLFSPQDSRYERIITSTLSSRKTSSLIGKLWTLFGSFVTLLLPLNHSLPWRLITLINIAFVSILLGLLQKSNPDATPLSFFSGFVCGLLIAVISCVGLAVSLFLNILPSSSSSSFSSTSVEDQNNTASDSLHHRQKTNSTLTQDTTSRSIDLTSFTQNDDSSRRDSSLMSDAMKQEDYSSFEVLDSPNSQMVLEELRNSETLTGEDDYKGWMIEFIGDYELRNKSEIKLKLMFVKIENRVLYLCKPKNNHDVDSATCTTFVQQRIYDLNSVTNFSACLLLPKTVRNRQKWVWSKKYPIRLDFFDEQEQMTTNKTTATTNSIASELSQRPVQLTLFAKSCREKEEWFRRFKRVVQDNRMAKAHSYKRSSLQSDGSVQLDDTSRASNRSFRTNSPFSRPDGGGVMTSRSTHLLNEARRSDNQNGPSSTGLVRTKSCEMINSDLDSASEVHQSDQQQQDCSLPSFVTVGPADDSTLTQASAELFSRAVGFNNFMESMPNLDYRDYIERVIESSRRDATSTSDWFNALTGRIFFDVLSHNHWSTWFKKKIQRKLYRIRLPYFMETLTLTKIDLGTNAPQFLNVVSHTFDSFGLSIDFDMAYKGGLTLTFETKLNLLKIKSDTSSSQAQSSSNLTTSSTAASNTTSGPTPNLTASQANTTVGDMSNSNQSSESSLGGQVHGGVDSHQPHSESISTSSCRTSGESSSSDESESESESSSSDDEPPVDEISDWEDYGAEKTRQNIVKFVDKIASSRYFKQAAENRYIKKKLQDISNCPLVLVVQIQSLSGVLTVNVPPPQTDRVWYGFKPNPDLLLKALPKMGDREVNLSHVTDWIEKKLAEEFRKIFVIPNMEDIVLPVLKSDHLSFVTSTR